VQFELKNLVKWRGTPRYFIGKDPMLQESNLARLLLSSSVMPRVKRSLLSALVSYGIHETASVSCISTK
jgi:hypothetical protein